MRFSTVAEVIQCWQPLLSLSAGVLVYMTPCLVGAAPSDECSVGSGSQVEIGECLAQAEVTVEQTIELAFGFAMESAKDLDEVTGRAVAVPALESGQDAWESYRSAHCEFVGSTFGGGSGTGIAIRSCRIELGRARVTELMQFVR